MDRHRNAREECGVGGIPHATDAAALAPLAAWRGVVEAVVVAATSARNIMRRSATVAGWWIFRPLGGFAPEAQRAR